MTDRAAIAFSENRSFLQAIAYRMLGSVSDAEDIVQECFLKWSEVDLSQVQSAKAYLATSVTRMCINHMQSARMRREQYVGPWLPEPVPTTASTDPVEMAESLTMGFLVLLESLSPLERAVFLLSEVFDYNMDEIAAIVQKSSVNCRQILHRARTAIAQKRPRFQATEEEAARLVATFGNALSTGDLDALLQSLHPEVVLMTDGGGKVQSALLPIFGADKVARFFVGVGRKIGGWRLESVFCEINGEPGVLSYRDGELVSTVVFHIENGAIRNLFVVSNPEKLSHLSGLPCPEQ